jgi:hypothetical protein
MDNLDAHRRENIFSNMEELSSIYMTVKPLILLAEYYNSNHGIVLSSINELRNAFDHVMRSFFESANTKEEFFKAKGHLFRAAFDACEIIIIDRLEYINQFKNSVGFNSLYNSFPQYYTEVLPSISQIKERLAASRQNQDTPERLAEYKNIITQLIKTCDDLDRSAPCINTRNKKIDRTFKIQTSILAALLGSIGLIFTVCAFLNLSALITIVLIVFVVLMELLFIYKKKVI